MTRRRAYLLIAAGIALHLATQWPAVAIAAVGAACVAIAAWGLG